jgi:addiction module HigA family antidote
MMGMNNPAHPGEIIRETCLKPLDLTVTEAAAGLGVTRKALSDVVNGHAGISPEMALRLELAGWSTAETWLKMQLQRDIWEARHKTSEKPLTVRRFASKELTPV